jgi:hypothetical protein
MQDNTKDTEKARRSLFRERRSSRLILPIPTHIAIKFNDRPVVRIGF